MCGRRLDRVAERSLGTEIDAHAAIKPFVIGRRQLREHHQSEIDAGVRVPLVGIDEIRNLRRALDGDVAGVFLDRHGRRDFEIAVAVAGVFEDGGALIDAVRHGLDETAHVAIGHVEELADAGIDLGDAVFLDHAEEIAFADLTGADQGVEVALLVAARAHVGENEIDHVGARLAAVPNLDRRNAQALGVDFRRVRIVAGGDGAADIGQMTLADGPVAQLALVEDRLVHAHVDGVAAAEGRIVVQDQVAFMDVVAEIARHRLHRRNERTEMNGNVLPLQDHLRHMIEQSRRIIVRQIEDARSRGLLQRQRHLALRRLENAADHRQGDRIDRGLGCGLRCRLGCRLRISILDLTLDSALDSSLGPSLGFPRTACLARHGALRCRRLSQQRLRSSSGAVDPFYWRLPRPSANAMLARLRVEIG